MKRDIAAATATAIAIIIMVVAVVAMCASPVRADERAAAEAQFRVIYAEHPCRDAIYFARERNWNMLQSLTFRPVADENVVSLAMDFTAPPAPWQRSTELSAPVWEMRLVLTNSSVDMARYETMNGASSCVARWVHLGQGHRDWIVESIKVPGVVNVKRTIPVHLVSTK